MNVTRVYCHTCEETMLDAGLKRCAWCDTELTPIQPSRKYKRRKDSKWTDLKVNQCWEAYLSGHSCNAIAAVIWESMGYKSQNACSNNLYREFKLAGFRLRTQSQVTIARNWKHGKATREARANGSEAAYRRWFKEQNGRYNPDCEFDGCTKHAMDGDTFCYAHSPERRAEVLANLEGMRARSTQVFVPGEGHVLAKLTDAQAAEIKRRRGEKLADLAEEFGVTVSSISNIQRGKSWTHLEAA